MESAFMLKLVEHSSSEYADTVALRNEILRRPLGLTFDQTQLDSEGADFHLACYRNGELVGCLVLTPREDGELKMRQVAVSEAEQRSGVGRQLVVESERVAREHNFTTVTLHARSAVVGFYEKLGYQVVGESFEEVGILHRAMHKRL